MSATVASRDQFLGNTKRRYVEVLLPNGGLTVRIQSCSERDKSSYESSILNSKGALNQEALKGARRLLIAKALVDADGNRLFTDREADLLGDIDGPDMQLLFDEIRKLWGFEKTDVEELVKNSDAIRDDNSLSG